MKFSKVVALAALVSVGPTFAADKHDHAHEHESMHGIFFSSAPSIARA